jgi:hypothetical protein
LPQWVPVAVSALAFVLLIIIALAGTTAVTHAGCGCCSTGDFPVTSSMSQWRA